MVRRRPALPALVLAAGLALPAVVAAGPEDAGGCVASPGREVVRDGTVLEFAAPRLTAPELAATGDVTGDAIKHHRSATFFMVMDAAPGGAAELDIDLTWDDPNSDFDIFVFDSRGRTVGSSTAWTVVDGIAQQEAVSVDLDHCEPFTVAFRSWASSPADTLRATFTVTPEGDAGRAAIVEDTTAMYLSGDTLGNANNVQDYVTGIAGEGYPFSTALVADRPLDGDPNATTRPVGGFNDPQNALVPHWHHAFPGRGVAMEGDASALVWASTSTMNKGDVGTLMIDLYVGSTRHRVEIPGDQLGEEPRPFLVRFPGISDDRVRSVTLQVGTDPAVSSQGTNDTWDANHTVWFDSVQFQSRVLLPITGPVG